MRAILYSSLTCNPCEAAKKLLEQLGLEVEERDASRLAEEIPGVASLPVVVIGGRVIVGYAPEEIRRAVKEAGS